MTPIQSPPDILLAIENVDITYQGSIVALEDVSLFVPRGAIVALLGANGAGKTSMLRAISGLLGFHHGCVTRGTISLDGVSVLGADAPQMVRHGVAQVMEARRIFTDLSVLENLIAGSFSRHSRGAIAESLEHIFDMFPVLRERSTSLAGYLSGGEQQMLAIGRAMMARPRLLLLDEPSLGIAPKIVAQLVEVIRRINSDGTTIVLVEQNAHLALDIADHAVVLENGRVAMQGAASTLRDHPRIRDIYLGKSGDDGAHRSFKRAAAPKENLRVGEPLLAVRDVSLRFGGVQALSEVSFDVNDGELFAIIGPNGAGKSSIFNCLSALYVPQHGSIRLRGHEMVGAWPGMAARLGMARTFQNLGLFDQFDIKENLMLGRHPLMRSGFLAATMWLGRAHAEEIAHRRRVDEIINLLGLQQWRDTPVGTLPYGIRKLIEMGRALAMEPRLLLLDEPVAGMNLEEREAMARHIYSVRDQLGATVLLVEHDMAFVMDMADRIMVLDFGRVLCVGTSQEIQQDERVIAAYLGDTKIA